MFEVQRNFPPGSKCGYFKVYINSSHADEFLINSLLPFSERLIKDKKIVKFFFIRYQDTSFHIRIRFFLSDESNLGEVIDRFYKEIKKFIEQGTVWKYDISTYSREIERYELALVEEVETLFSVDSLTVLKVIDEIRNQDDEEYRWKLAIKYIDYYLELFHPSSLEKKYNAILRMSNNFLNEFEYNKDNLFQLNDIFRARRKDLYEILNESGDEVLLSMYKVLYEQDSEFRSAVYNIKDLCNTHKLIAEDYLGSYIHMMINRLFPEKNRVFELVLYYLLAKHYQSEIARRKKVLIPQQDEVKN
ncbi:thiopeptide-type bacteriocin biosynthesis protein [Hymenobacter cellulosivorans]|uniref:Thiopeptide-type bacteriocin biosynthesis protein n=1 Tax=Hymenobacter cellulosivorans TaxID=2932249 RepID=A0ABY4F6T1_9BACT|nr:thiopeptide-type bacteriocin biosynthesis protein [Hymenobacter cellulosivorans]UOQ52374.1 thiopeptide-type bacteriocin biosynthesis protein [Hymenobacter cellulosivorans]